jgi:hypothetical protein
LNLLKFKRRYATYCLGDSLVQAMNGLPTVMMSLPRQAFEHCKQLELSQFHFLLPSHPFLYQRASSFLQAGYPLQHPGTLLDAGKFHPYISWKKSKIE